MVAITNMAVTDAELDAIPKKYADALYYNQKGYGYEAAAAVLEINVGTVKSRVNRAKAHLATIRGGA